MRETHPVWLALGGVLATIGVAVVAVFIGIEAVATRGFSLWSRGWFVASFAVMCLGLLVVGGVAVDVAWTHLRRRGQPRSLADPPQQIDEASEQLGSELAAGLDVARRALSHVVEAGHEPKPDPVQAGGAKTRRLTRQQAQDRRKATLVRFMDQGEGYRERITRAIYPSPPSLIGNAMTRPLIQVLVIKWLSELYEYGLRELPEDFVKRIPTLQSGAGPQGGLDAIDATLALIEETVEAMDQRDTRTNLSIKGR